MTLVPFEHYVGPHEQIRAVLTRVKSDFTGLAKREISSVKDDDSGVQQIADWRHDQYIKLMVLIDHIEGGLEELEVEVVRHEQKERELTQS